jgi:hypothetical protein
LIIPLCVFFFSFARWQQKYVFFFRALIVRAHERARKREKEREKKERERERKREKVREKSLLLRNRCC